MDWKVGDIFVSLTDQRRSGSEGREEVRMGVMREMTGSGDLSSYYLFFESDSKGSFRSSNWRKATPQEEQLFKLDKKEISINDSFDEPIIFTFKKQRQKLIVL